MAVSLSLMFGRLGSIVGNLMFGSLLESACPATFYALGGVLIGKARCVLRASHGVCIAGLE